MATNIYKVFKESATPAEAYVHRGIEKVHNEPLFLVERMGKSIQSKVAVELDEHEIKNPLTAKSTRILFKILNKEFPDCGRKRGAILRYIQAYTPKEERDLPKALFNALRNL